MHRFRISLLLCAFLLLAGLQTGCLVVAGETPRNGRCRSGRVLVKHKGKWKCKKRHHDNGKHKGHHKGKHKGKHNKHR